MASDEMCYFCGADSDSGFAPLFSLTLGDYFHEECAKLTVEMHEGQQAMDSIEEARICLADLERRRRDLGLDPATPSAKPDTT